MLSTFEADVLSPLETLFANARVDINLSNCTVSAAQMNTLVNKLKTHTTTVFQVKLDLANIERDALPILTNFLNQNDIEQSSASGPCKVFLKDAMRLLDPSQTEINEKFLTLMANMTSHSSVIFLQGHDAAYPCRVISREDIERLFQLINQYEPLSGIVFNVVDLSLNAPILLEKIMQTARVSYLDLSFCSLERMRPESLKKLILSLLETSLVDLDLSGNSLHELAPIDLKEIALKVQQKESLKLFQWHFLTDAIKGVISSWPKDRQKAFLETQIMLQHKNLVPQALFAPALDSEEFAEIVIPFFDKCSSSHILNSWLGSHPSLKKIEADLRLKVDLSLLKSLAVTANPHSKIPLEFDFSLITQETPATQQFRSEIRKCKQSLVTAIVVRLLDQTEQEIIYLAQFINQLELPESTSLRLTEMTLDKKGLSRILALIKAITNQTVIR